MARLAKTDPDEPIALLWGADHLIKKEDLFRKTLRAAETLVNQDPEKIVFIGQTPRFPNQNLGYIEFGKELQTVDTIPVNEFLSFQYRPPLETAKQWVADKHHAWNLGYFVTTPKFLLEAI